MIIIRPIHSGDSAKFLSIAKQAHLGFYTLPKNPQLLEHRLNRSVDSFKKVVYNPELELYLFVAEESQTKELLGVSGIAATTGGLEPLYFFQQDWVQVKSHLPAVVKNIPLLTPVSYVRGPSEICSLFVLPPYRNSGVGRLLSLSRFLFIRSFPERFTGSFFAELRGMIDQNNSSPFWEGIGRHFFNMPLEEVHEMLEFGRGFINQFIPKHPIYTSLLPKEVQESIGQIDPLARGAFN
ncbi:MAG: arginine N-succinyltransferase, partial [Chlamydiales bacterium]